MAGMVLDIAFAHIPTKVVLACVDEFGNLLVHEVEETNGKIKYPLYTMLNFKTLKYILNILI